MRKIAHTSTSSRILLLTWLALAPACAHGGANPESVGASTEQQLTAAMQQSAAAWNRGDLDGFLAVYKNDPHTAFMAPTITYGLADIKARYARSYFKEGKPKGQLTYDDLKFRPLGSDHVIMTGRWHLTEPDTGKKQDGYYTLIWERTPSGWKIIHDHSS